MKNKIDINEIIEEYQCSGCIYDCKPNITSIERCEKHHVGTMIYGIGTIFLGLHKGFNRIGNHNIKLEIYESYNYNFLNVPVWKYFDGKNTLVRGLRPRINEPFIHILIGNQLNNINCFEITDEILKTID